MSADTIPNWKDMPDDIAISTLCWEDVYTYAHDELDRAPTESEVRDLFDTIQDRMTDVMGEMFSDSLSTIADMAIDEMLESKPYDQDSLNDEELTSKKYCHECKEVQETYWELNSCEKNPQGIDFFEGDHGNDDACEDEYCNPDCSIVESDMLTVQYVKEHAVFEKCVTCHQYFDSAGPQAEQSKTEQCYNCNGTGIFDTCVECGGPGCVYCTSEEGNADILSGKDCVLCKGTGKFEGTQILCLDDKQVTVDVKSICGEKLTQKTKGDIAEAFLNSNITDWEYDGEEIHDRYTLSIDAKIERSNNDEDYIIMSVTSKYKDCGCLHVYGWREL